MLMSKGVLGHTAFAPEHAFVVQVHAGTLVSSGQVAGRVEHVVSGKAERFTSLEALLAFIARVFHEIEERSTTEGD